MKNIITIVLIIATATACVVTVNFMRNINKGTNPSASAFIIESEEIISGSTTTVIRHKETGRRFVTKYSGGICELHDREAK